MGEHRTYREGLQDSLELVSTYLNVPREDAVVAVLQSFAADLEFKIAEIDRYEINNEG